MTGQNDHATAVLILSDVRDIADPLAESLAETSFGKNCRISQSSSQDEVQIKLAEVESYSAIFCARECSDWLTEELYDHLDDFCRDTDLIIVSGKSIAAAVRSFLQRQHLLTEGRTASIELQDHRLALQI